MPCKLSLVVLCCEVDIFTPSHGSMGYCILFVSLGRRLSERVGKATVLFLLLLAVALHSGRTLARNPEWASDLT